jgi:hypothetical protein
MIVWKGRGFLIAGIAFGCLLVSELLTRTLVHSENYYQDHPLPKAAAFLVAAAVVWLLSRPREEAAVALPFQQETSVLRSFDSLFFVPTRYWPAILCGLGVVVFFIPN